MQGVQWRITEEKLLKLGFKKIGDNVYESPNRKQKYGVKYTLIKCRYVGMKDESQFDYFMLMQGGNFITESWGISYLHELQNLYQSITKEELIFTDKLL